jgi:type IV secretion system protein VirB6
MMFSFFSHMMLTGQDMVVRHRMTILLCFCIALGTLFMTSEALAVDPAVLAARANQSNSCTYSNLFGLHAPLIVPALQAIIVVIDAIVNNAMKNLFDAIIGAGGFFTAISAAATLYVMFYGISFLLGFLPFTLAQGVTRLTKIAVVFTLVSPVGWQMFEDTFVTLFRDGGNYLTTKMAQIVTQDAGLINLNAAGINLSWGAGGFSAAVTGGIAGPVAVFNGLFKVVFTPRMFILIYAAIMTGPYGIAMGLAMLWAVWQLLGMCIKALEVYGVSIVVKAVLLGMGPIFISFLLFDKTKSIFIGWLNQLVSFTLQPVMMFTFIAFYVGLLEIAVWDMIPDKVHNPLNPVEACFSKPANSVEGSQHDVQTWRFLVRGTLYEGKYTEKGPTGFIGAASAALGLQPTFPIPLLPTLIVLLLAYIGKGMVMASAGLANSVASGAVNLATSTGNAIGDLASGLKNGGESVKKTNMGSLRAKR